MDAGETPVTAPPDRPPHRPPLYNLARGPATLTSVPPYRFDGVTIRTYPLRARINRLRDFCDDYLNLMPKEIALFRPSLPYVFLQLVHYGHISPELRNVGWVSQHEIAFTIFLDWFKEVGGRLEYQDTAAVSPFIFVDEDTSQATGREVYGWPKIQGWATPTDPWPHDPHAHHLLARISARVFPKVFRNVQSVDRVILEITHEAPPGLTQVPPDPGSPLNPFVAIPNAIVNGLQLWGQFLDMAAAQPTRGYDPRDLQSMPARFARLLSSLTQLSPPTANTVNLKQFRDVGSTDAICYQALVNSRMELIRFNRGSMLGDWNLLVGDPSAGFRVRIHEYASLPIVQTLGIEVDDREEGDEAPVAVLKPQFPFWADVDLRYTQGQNLCWRGRGTTGWWTPPEGPGLPPVRKGAETAPPGGHPYNTALGASNISLPGPFTFPNATVRVLPLLADRCRLQEFCDNYFRDPNDPTPGDQKDPGKRGVFKAPRFEVLGSYVYLLVWSFGKVTSGKYDIGEFAGRDVRFAIPVRWFKGGELISSGLVSPYWYSDSEVATVTGRELYGFPILHSQIRAPDSCWLDSAGPDPSGNQGLLQLDAPVMSALSVGQEMATRRLLEVFQGDVDVILGKDRRSWEGVAQTWGQKLKAELERKQQALDPPGYPPEPCPQGNPGQRLQSLMALALELLANQKPVNEFSLKQFRDAAQPDRACYQSIVRTPFVIERLSDLREIESQMHVRIHRIEGQPIVETLGLVPKVVDDEADILEPVRPFWMRLDLRMDAAKEIWVSLFGEEVYALSRPVEGVYYFQDQKHIHVGRGRLLEEIANQQDHDPPWDSRAKRQHLSEWAKEWHRGAQDSDRLLLSEAKEAMGVPQTQPAPGEPVEPVEPQMAIESILSHEWGNWGTPRCYIHERLNQQVRQKPLFCVRRDSVGMSAQQVFPQRRNDRAWRLTDQDAFGWFPGEEDAQPASGP